MTSSRTQNTPPQHPSSKRALPNFSPFVKSTTLKSFPFVTAICLPSGDIAARTTTSSSSSSLPDHLPYLILRNNVYSKSYSKAYNFFLSSTAVTKKRSTVVVVVVARHGIRERNDMPCFDDGGVTVRICTPRLMSKIDRDVVLPSSSLSLSPGELTVVVATTCGAMNVMPSHVLLLPSLEIRVCCCCCCCCFDDGRSVHWSVGLGVVVML
mmetsp:Transcript_27711/g.33721  ORF Transcript_27711/g.33721 Transcript_27711/m.33721 type:complete len:210 (+) Transcript_27711:1125-1754(+)